MTFYERYCELCRQKGVKPHSRQTAELIGISNALSVRWKEGILPRSGTLEKLSKFFGVSADYLLHGEDAVGLVNSDKELTEILQALAAREDLRMLFHISKNATRQDVELAAKMIEELRRRGE
ncbi:MAG: hypothetical protein II583_00735 [Oscillospiraceae bacterium]|nr:hypothetical protein [Oscillospiraceae bacterium]